MFSIQSQNQVLYQLSQLTSAASTTKRNFFYQNSKSVVDNHASENLCDKSFNEALKNLICSQNNLKSLPKSEWLNARNVKNLAETWDILTEGIKLPKKCRRIAQRWILISNNDANKVILQNNKHGITLSTKLSNNILSSKHPFLFEIRRGFKTERSIQAEGMRNPSILLRFKKTFGFEKTTPPSLPPSVVNVESDAFLKDILNIESMSPEEQQKVKLAFAEGYMAGRTHKSVGRLVKVVGILRHLLTIMFFITLGFAFLTAYLRSSGTVFKLHFGNRIEVDPEEITITFNDVKGVDEAKQELKDVVEYLRNPEKIEALGGKLPKGVLLVGSPGTGKTLLARAVAGEAGVPFFHAAGAEFDEILVGQGARRVRDLFKAAKERAPCVIFIDEIDSVGAKRTNSVLHPYANQTINQLLSEMDGFHQNEGVIVLGATNRRDDLDKALLRPGRFDVEVNVSTPDLIGRKEILELYLSKTLIRDVDVDILARGTTGFTGADLENMVNQAALRAAIDGADFITMKYLEDARDKVLMGPERKSRIPDEEANEITAYHEGGHAIVAYYTKGSHPLHKVTIIPRNNSLGHTAYMPEKENYHVTKKHLLATMDTMMGGRAAEEVVFGPDKITSGASDDLQQATKIATHMVKSWGMSENVGLRTHEEDSKSLIPVNNLSPATTELIDTEIKKILSDSYERAKTILKTHHKEHKELAEALLKYETLDAEDVKTILSGKSDLKNKT